MATHILSTVTDRVKTLTINRTDKRNAITRAMYGVMADAIFAYGEDDAIRALMIIGAGDFFTADNDPKDFSMAGGTDGPQASGFCAPYRPAPSR